MSTRILIPHRIIPENLYVKREADRQLASILADMASPGYVLVSRQMGKTNLLLNAKRTFQDERADVYTYIDLSNAFATDTQCFRNIIDKSVDTHKNLLGELKAEIKDIRAQEMPAHLEHLSELRLILDNIPGKMVIILDEIDALTRANFSDKIFSQIRSIYFERDSYPELKRLTYILSGVVEPTEIIRDSKISPFNIGQKIFLDDFSFQEHQIFLNKADLNLSDIISERIFYWTSGNPRMTYDICSEVEKEIIKNVELSSDVVDQIVKALYLTNFDKAPIDHIRELVADDKSIRDAITIIRYGKGSEIEHDTKTKLYLSGIINSDFTSNSLGIKNRIIEASLSDAWIKNIENKNLNSHSLILGHAIRKDYKKVIELYNSLNGNFEDFVNSTFYSVGVSYFKTGVFDKAIAAFEKAVFDSNYDRSGYIETKYLLAESYSYNNEPSKAIELFNEIIDFDVNGKYYYLSSIPLGNIYIDFEKGKHVSKAVEYFKKILECENELVNKYPEDFDKETLASVHLYYGLALAKLKNEPEAKAQFELALRVSNGYTQPVIYLGIYNIEKDVDEKLKILNKIVDVVIKNKLYPNPESDYYSYFSGQVLYKIFYALNLSGSDRMEEFCDYFLAHEQNLKGENFGDVLINLAFTAATNVNFNLAASVLYPILFGKYSQRLSPEYTYNSLKVLISTYKSDTEKLLQAKMKLYDFLIQNKRFDLTAFDLDVIISLADVEVGFRRYDQVRNMLDFLYVSLDRTTQELKSSKYLIELIEIKVLESSHFDEAAITRSKQLLGNINKLTLQDIDSNPLLRSSIDNLKLYLTSINMSQFAKIPARIYGDNERVNVKYKTDGKVLYNIKYRKVRRDLNSGQCQIV